MKPLLRDTLCIEGIAPHRALDKLARRGVCVYGARKTGAARLNFEVRAKDTEKVFAIFARSCYTVTKTGSSRAKRLLSAVRRRPGFVCGAALLFVLSFAADRLVLRVEVAGSAARYARQAEALLREEGVGTFTLYSEAAAGRAKARLLSAFADVAFAEVQKSGCVVYVTLEEGDVPEVPVRKSELAAPVAGVVEELTVLRGEACAAEGQAVEAGQLLAAGRLAGADGTYTETFVSARCVLRCTYIHTAEGSGSAALRRAVAEARLCAERDLLCGDAKELTVTEERAEESGGTVTVTLTLRLVLAAGYS